MLTEPVLDLDAVDLVARAVDHVLEAIEDPQVAVGVEAADVARAPEAGGKGGGTRRGRLPVAGHDHRAADPDLARNAGQKLATGLVDDPQIATGDGEADRIRATRRVVRRHDGRGRGGLGGAIEIHQPELGQQRREPGDRGLRHRRPAIAADPPGAKLEGGELRLEEAEVVHRRHQDCVGDPLACRQLEKAPGLERGHQDRAAGRPDHGEQHCDEACDVGRGHCQQRAVLRPEVHGQRVVEDRMDDVEMGQQRALGSPGRAGGVEDDRDVLLRGLVRGRRRRAGSPAAPRSRAPPPARRARAARELGRSSAPGRRRRAPPRTPGSWPRSAPACSAAPASARAG